MQNFRLKLTLTEESYIFKHNKKPTKKVGLIF